MRRKSLALALVGASAVASFASTPVTYLPSTNPTFTLSLSWTRGGHTFTHSIDDVSYIDLVQPGGQILGYVDAQAHQNSLIRNHTPLPGTLTFVMTEQDHSWWLLANAAYKSNSQVDLILKVKYHDTPAKPADVEGANEDISSFEQGKCTIIKLAGVTDISVSGSKQYPGGFPRWFCEDRDNPRVYVVTYSTLSFSTPTP